MEKNSYIKLNSKLSFIDKLRYSFSGKKPECKNIIEQAEEIVENYILNARLQGITLYKKRGKWNFKRIGIALVSLLPALMVIYFLIR